MNELSSFLPPVEPTEVKRMRIERLHLQSFPMNRCKTKFTLANKGESIFAQVYKVDNESTRGFIPTKVWSEDGQFHFLYYVSEFLPKAARPFGDDPCYVFCVYTKNGDVIEYDADIRIFIDQIQTPIGMAYVFIFGETEMRRVLATHWSGESWEKADPVIQAWNQLESSLGSV